MTTSFSVIDELEDAISSGSQDKRIETLRRVTDLFLDRADHLDEAQVGIFDDVLRLLIKRIETKAVVELSTRLAPIKAAPIEVIRAMARDPEIAIAGPILTQSPRLTTSDLVEIAQTRSQGHLLAISGRAEIEPPVTDVLVTRGDRQVVHRVAQNAGASFSDFGFATLVRRAEGDEELAKSVGTRIDLSPALLQELLAKATESVRGWLVAQAPSEARLAIERAVDDSSHSVASEAAAPLDFTVAKQLVTHLKARGELNEAALLGFIRAGQYEEIVAALADLCAGSLDLVLSLMRNGRHDGLLVACKAAGLDWTSAKALLSARFRHHSVPELQLAQANADYAKLTQSTAQRMIRFWQVRKTAAKS